MSTRTRFLRTTLMPLIILTSLLMTFAWLLSARSQTIAAPRIAASAQEYTLTSSSTATSLRYDWIDARNGGGRLSVGDDEMQELSIPFDFSICNTTASKLLLSNNGGVLFATEKGTIPPYNQPLADTTLPGEFVAPFWDDLGDTSGGVYTRTVGTSPHRRFVIEWHRRPHFSLAAGPGTVTFQMILYETTGNIKFQYQDTVFGNTGWDYGASATVGLRCSDGSINSFAYNEAKLQNQMALCLQRPGQPGCDSQPVESVTISGPTIGYTEKVYGEYTFVAEVSPGTAQQPLTYVWEATDHVSVTHNGIASTQDSLMLGWDTPGKKEITVTVSNDDGSATTTHLFTIPDKPQFQFGASKLTVPEGMGTVPVSVTLLPTSKETLAVECISAPLTQADNVGALATADDDYTPITQTLVFTPGQAIQHCRVSLSQDSRREADESFALQLRHPYPPDTPIDESGRVVVLTIEDDDEEVFVNFSQAEYSADEGSIVPINVTLSDKMAIPVMVDYTTRESTARAGAGRDYMRNTGTLTFAPGTKTATFSVTLLADAYVEGSETVLLQLGDMRNGVSPGSLTQAELTIVDDPLDNPEGVPVLQFARATSRVYEQKDREANIVVERSGDPDIRVTVDVATFDGSATARRDYARRFKKLVFASGVLTQSITLPITDDTEIEGDETVILALNNPTANAVLGTQQTTQLIIGDNDAPPEGVLQFAASNYYVSEDEDKIAITVKRSGGVSKTVSVSYLTSDLLLATAGEDYTARSGRLEFAEGDSEETFTIPITDDTEIEGDETFLLQIKSHGGAVIGTQHEAKVTIIDDETVSAGIIQFRTDTYYVDEESEQATILVDRVGGSEGAVSIDFATSGGSASPDVDYEPVSGRLVFGDGVTSRSFVVPVVKDILVEEIETVRLVLGHARSNNTEEQQAARVTTNGWIAQDDVPAEGTQRTATLQLNDSNFSKAGTIDFTHDTFDGLEGNQRRITVRRTGGTQGKVEVGYTIRGVDGADETDFTLDNHGDNILVFEDGSDEAQEIVIRLLEDDDENEGESILLQLKELTGGATFGRNRMSILNIHDKPQTGTIPPRGYLTVSSPNVLPDQEVLLLATLLDTNNEPIAGSEGIKVIIDNNREKPIVLHDNGQNEDMTENDGIYTRFAPIPAVDKASNTLSLMIGEERIGRDIVVHQVSRPELVVLTNWAELYDEFQDTGMNPLRENRYDQRTSDEHVGTDTHDFFDLVDRVRAYATERNGIVINLPGYINGKNNFSPDYSKLYYGKDTSTRKQQADLIDQAIARLVNETNQSIQFLAILGDDQVVPFYRVYDPTDYYGGQPNQSAERHYVEVTPDKPLENAVLTDMLKAYLMSDVPYGIRTDQRLLQYPETWESFGAEIVNPEPDIGVGRIFATHPAKLIHAINQYELELPLASHQATASFFGANDEINFQNHIQRSLIEHLPYNYTPFFQGDWDEEDFINSLQRDTLVSAWAHSTHKFIHIDSLAESLPSLDSQKLSALKLHNHPVMFVGLGCHMGLSVSNFPDNIEDPDFHTAVVNPLIRQGVTVFAPSSQAYAMGDNVMQSPNIHEKMVSLFATRAANDDNQIKTVGNLWRSIFPVYHAEDPYATKNPDNRRYHLLGAYGMALYGLPTQPVVHAVSPDEPLACEMVSTTSTAQRPSLSASYQTIPLEVSLPKIDVRKREDGLSTVQMHNGATTMIAPGGIILPVVVRSFELPDNVVVSNVSLLEHEQELHTTPVTLAHTTLQSTNGDTIPFVQQIPDLYPQEVFTYTVTPYENGSLLLLKMIPVQYVSPTRQLTLSTRMRFVIDMIDVSALEVLYDDNTNVSLTSDNENKPRIHDFQPETVRINEPGSFRVDISSGRSDSIDIVWVVRDPSAEVIETRRQNVEIPPGVSQFKCTLDTTGWNPGEKDILVSLKKERPTDKKNRSIQAQGVKLVLMEEQDAQQQDSEALTATWRIKVYDEYGVAVTNLTTSAFTVTIDGGSSSVSSIATVSSLPQATVNEENSDGIYTITYPLDTISPGTHQVRIYATDTRGITNWWDTTLNVPERLYSPVYLPIVRR